MLLDNAASVEQVRPLLPGGTTCLVLITSRNRLAGLDARPMFLDLLSPDEAVDLLREVLGKDLVDGEPEAAAELARLCGYLPLALRIAAANAGTFLADVVTGLREENRLTALSIDDDEQVAVRATFDLSYKALDADTRRLFRRLGLVPGLDFTADAATQLADGPAEPLLDKLVAANLLEHYTPGRYRLHDLLRLYADDRAQSDDTSGERQAARTRLFAWYVHSAQNAGQLVGPEFIHLSQEQGTGLEFDSAAGASDWLESERANFVAVSQYPVDSVSWQLADSLHGFFRRRRHCVDWMSIATAGVQAATRERDPLGLMAAHHSVSSAHWSQGRFQQAIDHNQIALDLSRQARLPKSEARLLTALGHLYKELGDVDLAIERYRAAIEINREPQLLFGLGATCWQQGRLREAEDLHGQAQALAEERGAEFLAGFYLGCRGGPLRDLGELELAEECMTRSLAVLRAHGARDYESYMLDDLSWAARDAGRYDDAMELGLRALAIAEEIGDPGAEVDARNTVASVQTLLGQTTEAAANHRRALGISRKISYRHGEVQALNGLAAASQGDEYAHQALSLSRTAGYKLLEAQALTCLAAIHLAAGDRKQALRYGDEALAMHRTSGHQLGQERTARILSKVTDE